MDPAPDEDLVPSHLFSPPLWTQRLDKVRATLFDLSISEVCDLGCGSGKLLEQLKAARCTRLLIGVDLDKPALDEAWERCEADFQDYHFRRTQESAMYLYLGSILCPSPSLPFQLQCVTLCEVIEHVTLLQVPALTDLIFRFINPKYAIVTTPNSDFNVVFRHSGFRHPDHKFEWSRQEFAGWIQTVCSQYGYEVMELTGVGEKPGTDIGFCTQIVVLRRRPQCKLLGREDARETYQRLHSVVYPFAAEKTFAESFSCAVIYQLYSVQRHSNSDDSDHMKLTHLYAHSTDLQSFSDGQYPQFLRLLCAFRALVDSKAGAKFSLDLDSECITFRPDSDDSDDRNTD